MSLNKVLIVVTKIEACGLLVEMEVLHGIRGTASRVKWQVVFISFTVLVLGVGSSEVQIFGSDSKTSILCLGCCSLPKSKTCSKTSGIDPSLCMESCGHVFQYPLL